MVIPRIFLIRCCPADTPLTMLDPRVLVYFYNFFVRREGFFLDFTCDFLFYLLFCKRGLDPELSNQQLEPKGSSAHTYIHTYIIHICAYRLVVFGS